jgi:hypothetical protein
MSTVAILGAGELGGAVAHALAERGCASRLLLVDAHGQVAAGKALDIQQAGAIRASSTKLDGTTDPTRVAGCGVCVVADRFGPPSAEWRRDDRPWAASSAMPARSLSSLREPRRSRSCRRWRQNHASRGAA